jgi:hypothetical protein
LEVLAFLAIDIAMTPEAAERANAQEGPPVMQRGGGGGDLDFEKHPESRVYVPFARFPFLPCCQFIARESSDPLEGTRALTRHPRPPPDGPALR